MTVQNIINEVNSIQTKKKAIKDAITAKGVTSKGKLSKFADEINKITTKEPDWYIVNKFRYDNGNEALFVRTSDKNAIRANKYQMVEIGGGVTKDNDISNSFNVSYNDDFGITNGSYFPRETAYRSFTTREDSNIVFNGHNDNLKLKLRGNKEIVFNDVNVYNWLKGYRNQPLADYDSLYLKSDGFSERNPKNLSDFLAPTNKSTILTVGTFGATPMLLIDSSIMIQAMSLREMSKIGFISYSDKAVDTISLAPVYYANNEIYAPFYNDKERYYGNLSPGNYVQLFKNGWLFTVFISVNYVIDSNGQQHKNIEVCIYKIIERDNSNIDVSKVDNKPFELYLTFSGQAQQQLQQASNTKVFRKKVLRANGTPEPRISNFLTGKDMLIEFGARKVIVEDNRYVKNFESTISNLFLKDNDRRSNTIRYTNYEKGIDIRYGSSRYSTELMDDIYNNNKPIGFVRLNNNTNHMYSIELEEVNRSELSSVRDKFSSYLSEQRVSMLPNGFVDKNIKMIIFLTGGRDTRGKAYYLKKSGTNEYITNDSFTNPNGPETCHLYITTDAETQNYIKSKPLTTIWTEIQDVLANKEEYEAYDEQ